MPRKVIVIQSGSVFSSCASIPILDDICSRIAAIRDARVFARKLARDGRREFAEVSDELGEKLQAIALKSAREGQVRLRQLEARLKKFERQEKARRANPARRAK